MTAGSPIARGAASHRSVADLNRRRWDDKPLLRAVYEDFHRLIAAQLAPLASGAIVELGSGAADIRRTIPGCIRTDLFPFPGIDRVENAYRLSFPDSSVASLILFDVFHHLRYPGTALAEFRRVLLPGGRVILFEPCVSLLGRLVYGPCHPEPLGLGAPVEWTAPAGWTPDDAEYHAAQAAAWRLFIRREHPAAMDGWTVVALHRLAALAYVASGGYTRPQLYPLAALPLMRALDRLLGLAPALFATRLLVALEKPAGTGGAS